MSNSYRRFLNLLKDWPLDPTKRNRDLGEHIRDQIKIAFATSEQFQGDQQKCDLEYLALRRLADNYYVKKYPRSLKSSAIGLSLNDCKEIISNEFLESLKEEEKSALQKLFSRKSGVIEN